MNMPFLAGAAALAFGLSPFVPASPQELPARELLADAQRELEAERIETGVLRLRQARTRAWAAEDPAIRAELTAQIGDLLARKDPVAKVYDAALETAASTCIALAKEYEAKEWYATALGLAREADKLRPGSAGELLAALLAASGAREAKQAAPSPGDWFSKGEELLGYGEFARDGAKLVYKPQRGPLQTSFFLTERRLQGQPVRCSMEVRPFGDGGFGAVFGFVHSENHFRLGVILRQGEAALSVYRVSGGEPEPLIERVVARESIELAQKNASGAIEDLRIPVEFTLEGDKLSARIGMEVLDVGLGDPPADGFLGLCGWKTEQADYRCEFANVQVRAQAFLPRLVGADLGEDAGSEAEAVPPTLAGVEVTVGEARGELEGGDPEAAAARLRVARRDLLAIPDGATRHKLKGEVEALLAKADGLDAAGQKRLELAAKDLLNAAQAYSRRKWPRAALAPLRQAHLLHPASSAKRLAEGRAAIASEHEQTTQSALEEWFARGKVLLGGGSWKSTKAGIESPKPAGQTLLLGSQHKTASTYRLKIEARSLHSRGKFAVAFGMNVGGTELCLLELMHARQGSQLRLLYLPEGKEEFELLAAGWVTLTGAEKADFVELSVSVEGDHVTAGLGDLAQIEARAPKADLSGHLGLFVSGDTQEKEPVVYRRLRVE